MDNKPYPLCFDSRNQYEMWKLAGLNTGGVSSGICTDCTPEYKKEMLLQERCTEPSVKFGLDEDGLVFGYIPKYEKYVLKKAKATPVKWLPPEQAPSVKYEGGATEWFPTEFKQKEKRK